MGGYLSCRCMTEVWNLLSTPKIRAFAFVQEKIKDKLGLLELRADLLLKVPGRAGNAEAAFR